MNRDIKPRNGGWDTAECPVCGKEFFPTPQWVYKLSSAHGRLKYKPVCSYGCLCRAQKEIDAEKQRKAELRVRRERRDNFSEETGQRKRRRVRCINTGKEYESLHLAELDTGVSRACIGSICRGCVERHKGTGLRFEFLD